MLHLFLSIEAVTLLRLFHNTDNIHVNFKRNMRSNLSTEVTSKTALKTGGVEPDKNPKG